MRAAERSPVARDLLRRLRVERTDDRALNGRFQGVDLAIDERSGRAPGAPSLRARIGLPRATDLRCELRRVGEAHLHPRMPARAETPPRRTGDPELDDWLELRGDVEPARVVQWIGPDERRALRALDGVPGLLLERGAVSVLLPLGDPDAQEASAAALRDAALALDAARARVPVAAELAAAHGTFIELGAAMQLAVSTCPLAVEGSVDGFDVLIHLPNWGPFEDDVILLDVCRPGPRGATWETTSAPDGLARRALRAAVRTLGRVALRLTGERSPRLDRAFHRLRAVRRTMMGDTAREIELPMGFVLASAADGRIVAATRLPRAAPELEACARRLVAVLASAPPPPPDAERSPYRT